MPKLGCLQKKPKSFVDEINEDLQAAACLSDKIQVPDKFKALIPQEKRMSKKYAQAKLSLI